MSVNLAVGAARPRRMVFGMGSRFFPRSRLSVGAWALGEILGRSAALRWKAREDLMAEVAEVGDTVYVRPLTHILEHNRVPLARVKDYLGLAVEKVLIVHHDSELAVGAFSSSFGGRTKHNPALSVVAATFKEEGFGRVGLGVAPAENRYSGLFPQGFRGVTAARMDRVWLVNRLTDAQLELVRTAVLDKVELAITGSVRAGGAFDRAHRY